MKTKILKRVKGLFAPAALVIAMVAFSPASALAATHGGGRGFGGGHGGGFSGGGRSYSGAVHGNFGGGGSYGGRGYSAGRAYGGSFYNGGRYYGGRGYYGRGYYGPGFGFGIYAQGYAYAAPVCGPAGFYDQNGYWHYYRGCIASPYGY